MNASLNKQANTIHDGSKTQNQKKHFNNMRDKVMNASLNKQANTHMNILMGALSLLLTMGWSLSVNAALPKKHYGVVHLSLQVSTAPAKSQTRVAALHQNKTFPLPKPMPLNKRDKATAIRFYNEGKLTKSTQLLQELGMKKQVDAIVHFAKIYTKGQFYFRDRYIKTAKKYLHQSLRMDKAIGGGKSVFAKHIRRMIADIYIMKSRISLNSQSYRAAYLYLEEARIVFPERSIQPHMKTLHKLANKWFYQGMRLRIAGLHGESKKLLIRARKLLPPQSKLYQDIEHWLSKTPNS